MCLADLYSNGRDMEKAISSYRWSFANGNRPQEVKDHHIITISRNFNRFKNCEYTIEVLEGSMALIRTFDEWAQSQAETYLIQAYTQFGEFLKAKATNKKCLSTDRNNWTAVMQSGEIEEGLCNYKAAIAHFRNGVAELQKQEHDGDSLSKTRVMI
jgi:tetratricopeptide (TPR) repeat protein